MPPRVLGRATASRGFTLIELLVVMTIIAIAFFALRPSFSGVIRGAQERNALRQLVGLFASARTEAVARGMLVRVVLDGRSGAFRAEVQAEPERDRSAFDPVRLLGRTEVRLPEHVWLGEVEVGGYVAGPEGTQIYFYPDGRTDGAAIRLVDSGGGSTVIVIAPATGKVSLNA